MSVGETLHNTVWSVASGGAMEALRSAVLPRAQLQRVLAQSHLLHRDDVRVGQGSGRRGVPQFFKGFEVISGAAVGVAGRIQQLEQKGFFFAAQPAEAVSADGVGGQCAGGGIDLHHPHQLADFR